MFKNTQKSGDSRAAGPKLLVGGCGLINTTVLPETSY